MSAQLSLPSALPARMSRVRLAALSFARLRMAPQACWATSAEVSDPGVSPCARSVPTRTVCVGAIIATCAKGRMQRIICSIHFRGRIENSVIKLVRIMREMAGFLLQHTCKHLAYNYQLSAIHWSGDSDLPSQALAATSLVRFSACALSARENDHIQ